MAFWGRMDPFGTPFDNGLLGMDGFIWDVVLEIEDFFLECPETEEYDRASQSC